MNFKNHILKIWFSEKIFDLFDENFAQHKDVINSFLENDYFIYKIFFRDILSWENPEIESSNINLINKTIKNWKSELVPVLVFKNINNISFCLELHSNSNPF